MTGKLLLILILLTPAACGGQNQTQDKPPPYGPPAPLPPVSTTTTAATSDTSTPPSGDVTSSTPAPQPTTTPPKPKNKLIKWLQNFTPTGGGGTTRNGVYTAFMQGDCWRALALARTKAGEDTLEPLEEPYRSLYEGAATACLAALHGRADLWRTAEVNAARVRASDLNCWDRSVFLILEALVDAHRADARTRFTRSSANAAGCPELRRTEPSHGPAEGGYRIEIRGRNFPPALNLSWNNRTITAHRTSSTTMELTVPPAEADEDSVDIKIDEAPRITPAYAGFAYDR